MTSNPTCPYCSSIDTTFKAKAQLWECDDCEERFEDPSARKVDSQTIFLSYAHKSENVEDYDISEDLVWLIKAELEKDGHMVWIDHEGIRGGTQWRERITDAITSHKHFLAFLSKRSVRQEPNVCLNEVAIAIKHNRIIQTILTESESQVSAPLTLSSIQWHKFQDWKEIKEGKKRGSKGEDWDVWFDNLMAGIRQNLADISHQKAVGELAELKDILQPTSFEASIIKSVDGFFGRQWLFDATNEWFKTDNRLFWLKGTPGIGKSSFAAKLVHSGNSSIVGFFKCDFQGLKSAEESASECIRTLAYQLASRLPDYRIKLLRGQQVDQDTVQKKTADDLFTYLITEPLNRSEKIAESERLALVIDALDEAGRQANGKIINPLADLLYKHADQLPPWLGVIITSRPEAYLQQQLGAKFTPLIMEGSTQNNLSDIRDYLETKLDSAITGEQRANTIASIIDKSGGTFLYIKRVELGYDLSKPENLPKGLDDLFYKDFERYFPDSKIYEEKTEKFLRLLAISPGPLPKQLAQDLLQWQARDITQYVTQPMASLLTETEEGLQFFHKSIKDWLQDGSRSGIYQVNETGARELGDYLWNEFERNQPKDLVEAGQEKAKRTPSLWEKQIIEWLPTLLPDIEQWGSADSLNSFLDFSYENLKFLTALSVGYRSLDLTLEEFGEKSLEAANILSSLGTILNSLGRYKEVESLWRKSLEIRENILGLGHEITAGSLNNLALVLDNMGRYEEAEPIYRRSLESYESIFGNDHPDTARSLSNLGLLLSNLGRYEEAESLYKRSLEIREKVLGMEHFDTATSLNNLGLLMRSLGRYQEAESLSRRSLSIYESILGPQNPDVATSLSNLGLLLNDLGRYDEAELLFKRSLEIREKILGLEHPDTATSLNNLGLLFHNTGRYEEAEPLWRNCLDIYENALGPDHPLTATSLNNLGFLISNMGRNEEAEPLYRRSLEIREKILGAEHPDTLGAINNLGLLFYYQGRLEESEYLWRKALLLREKVLGDEHPDTATSLSNLGLLLSDLGRYEEAEPLYKRALEIREKILGPEHPDTATSLNNLGLWFFGLGRYEEAENFYLRALAAYEKIDSHHPDSLQILSNLSGLFETLGRYSDAEPLLRKALEINEQTFGSEHPNFVLALNNLGLSVYNSGRSQEAEPFFRRALLICEKLGGLDLVIYLENLAHSLFGQNRYEEAEPLYRRALEIREKSLGNNHVNLLTPIDNLVNTLNSLGRNDETVSYLRWALDINEATLGSEHPDIMLPLSNLGLVLYQCGESLEAEKIFIRMLKIADANPITGQGIIESLRSLLHDLYHSLGKPEEASKFAS